MSEGNAPAVERRRGGDGGRGGIVAVTILGVAILAFVLITHWPGPKHHTTQPKHQTLSAICSGQQNCRIGSLVIPGNGRHGVDVDNIRLVAWRQSDFYYDASGGAGDSYIFGRDDPEELSLDVTKQNASRHQCNIALAKHTDKAAILNLHKGLMFCADGLNSASFALFEVSRDVGPTGTLYLKEVRWRTSFD